MTKSRDDLSGWSKVIQDMGKQARATELYRQAEAASFLLSISNLEGLEKVRVLLTAHYEGILNSKEYFAELRKLCGIPEEP